MNYFARIRSRDDVALVVCDWGPRETNQGVAVNCQPDGSSAIWIRIERFKPIQIDRVRYGEYLWRPATVHGTDLITSFVPDCIIQRAGKYEVFLIGAKQERILVGHFRVHGFPREPSIS